MNVSCSVIPGSIFSEKKDFLQSANKIIFNCSNYTTLLKLYLIISKSVKRQDTIFKDFKYIYWKIRVKELNS